MAEMAYAVLRVDDERATYFDDEVVELVPTVYVPGILLVDTAEPFTATAF
jgi:hypothetical protein